MPAGSWGRAAIDEQETNEQLNPVVLAHHEIIDDKGEKKGHPASLGTILPNCRRTLHPSGSRFSTVCSCNPKANDLQALPSSDVGDPCCFRDIMITARARETILLPIYLCSVQVSWSLWLANSKLMC